MIQAGLLNQRSKYLAVRLAALAHGQLAQPGDGGRWSVIDRNLDRLPASVDDMDRPMAADVLVVDGKAAREQRQGKTCPQ
jgi:hypothetical protein